MSRSPYSKHRDESPRLPVRAAETETKDLRWQPAVGLLNVAYPESKASEMYDCITIQQTMQIHFTRMIFNVVCVSLQNRDIVKLNNSVHFSQM